ncbi:hypothetical protein AB205_0115500, partial [Aquarana catesbeiana]
MSFLLYIQSGNLRDSTVEIKEEIKEEDDEDGVMEESEFPKGHKDLYQDTMVESSSYRNPLERCPHPLHSRDSTQEGHTIPHHHQDMMEPPNTRNPPERCPHPLYSRDSTQEGHTIPHHHQDEERIDIKAEVKKEEEDETYVMGDQQYMKEDEVMDTIKEEDPSLYINP